MDCIICQWLEEQEKKLDWEMSQLESSRKLYTYRNWRAERKLVLQRQLRHDRLKRNHEKMYHPGRMVIRG